MKKAIACAGLIGAGIILTSCPQPLTDRDVLNAKDTAAPVISVDAPEDNAAFGRVVVIQGRVSDAADASGEPGRVERFEYEVLARSPRTPAAVAPDGSFLIEFSTDLRENIVVELRAVDWNGNVGTRRLPLAWRGNDIPSFDAAAGTRSVTLSWDPVPGAGTYDLYFEASALAPTESSPGRVLNVPFAASGGRLSYEMRDLRNGTVYSFLLVGRSSAAEDNFSDVVRAVPLSTFNLFPRVDPNYTYIDVSWRTLSGVGQYEVLRSVSRDGPYLSASGPVTGSSYRDQNVLQGVTYYYRVRPYPYASVDSQAAEAVADPLPSSRSAEIGFYTSVEFPVATAVKDSYLYIADYYGGLRVASIAEPSTPVPVAAVESLTAPRSVVVEGNYAYVTHWQSLSVFNVSNPASPVLLDTIQVTTDDGGQAEGLAVLGNLVFVARFNDGFAVVNAAEKSSLQLVHQTTPEKAAELRQVYAVHAIERSGTRILAVGALDNTELYTVDGTDSAPTLTLRSGSMPGAVDVNLAGEVLYITSNWYLYAYGTANLGSPVLLDTVQPSDAAGTYALALSGDKAYVTLGGLGFAVVDVANPSSLEVKQVYTVPGESAGISVSGSYAFISGGRDYGVYIYGVAGAGSASLVNTLPGIPGALNLNVVRDHLYVAAYGSDWTLSVLGLANPAAPSLLGSPYSYSPYRVKAAGDFAFWAAERAGIAPVNIMDPSTPRIISPPSYVSLTGGYAMGIDITGNYALLTTAGSRLHVVDLSWDGTLPIISTVQVQPNTFYAAPDVKVRGDLAFVAASEAGLRVVDISDPKWPRAVSGYGDRAGAGDKIVAVAVKENYVLAADETAGLFVFDVSGAASWTGAVASVTGPLGGAGALDVVVRGSYAYVAKGAAGVQMWDISDPRAPTPVFSLPTPSAALRLAVHREYLYVTGQAGAVYTIKLVP